MDFIKFFVFTKSKQIVLKLRHMIFHFSNGSATNDILNYNIDGYAQVAKNEKTQEF